MRVDFAKGQYGDLISAEPQNLGIDTNMEARKKQFWKPLSIALGKTEYVSTGN